MPSLLPVFQPLSPDDPREVGGYRLHARLGAGGMGRVYLSYTPGGRPVALKVVRPELAEDEEFRRRFAQEVASARRIHGLYTAQVVDSGDDWLATAYVPGPSLQQVVREAGPLPARTVLLLTAGIAEALQVIHAAGVVHRDLKPANVLVAADGPRVIDFGIARAADAELLTATGVRIGSAAFMSPEQAQGHPVTAATDVWALGALAAFVSSGVPPFGEGAHTALLYRIVHEGPDLSRVPDGLRELLLGCLAKDPADRPTTAALIAAAAAHPEVGGRLRFGEDWLPRQVSTGIVRHADLPGPGPADAVPTVLDPAPADPPATVRLTLPAQRTGPSDRPAEPAGPRRGVPRWAVAGIALAGLLAGGFGGVWLYDRYGGDDPTDGPTGYSTLYADTELAAPDSNFDFDLANGKVVPQQSAQWIVGRGESDFYWSDDSDVYTGHTESLGLQDCLDGLDTHPVTALPYAELPAGQTFCVRSRTSKDVAIAKLLTAPAQDGAMRISVSAYHHEG